MSILHSPRRDEHLPQGYLLLEQTINFNLFYDFTEEDFGHSAKKIKTFRTAFNLSGGQIVWKNVFFLDSIQFYTFVRTVTKTHSKVRLKSHLWVLQTALYVSEWKIRTKWLSFEPFIFKFFSRLWAENIQQWYENLILRVQMDLWRMRF